MVLVSGIGTQSLVSLLCLTVGAAVSLPGQQEAEGKEQH